MRRIALIVFAAVVLFVPDRRPVKALPMYGVTRYYYANGCELVYCRSANGTVGAYLGQRYDDCYNRYYDIQESDLVGYDNWKQEIVYDCQTGQTVETWYHGGYQIWVQATPDQECMLIC